MQIVCLLQFGWILKGLVYAIIGGVACQASAEDKEKINGADISPQVAANAARPPVHLWCLHVGLWTGQLLCRPNIDHALAACRSLCCMRFA